MKKYIFGLITGLLIAGSAVYASNYLYKADEVSYDPKDTNWNVDNVDSAIKELYNKISEANSALLALKNTAIAKAVGANGDTFTSVINKLGAITDQKNKSFTVSNTSSITIPAGYYNGQGTINVSGLVPAPTGTFTPSAHGTQIDMGANNTYRYINTTNVWNQAVAAADARANASSANYQAGYNAGVASVNQTWHYRNYTLSTPSHGVLHLTVTDWTGATLYDANVDVANNPFDDGYFRTSRLANSRWYYICRVVRNVDGVQSFMDTSEQILWYVNAVGNSTTFTLATY